MNIFKALADRIFGHAETDPIELTPAKARAYVKATKDGRVALYAGDDLVYTYASRAAATRGAARRGLTIA